MADSAASTLSRTPRAGSANRRPAAVSTDTENKLARAARSAQRLAQLSDVPRDESTLDMFPDDPTRATLEAMNIDVRQGTLTGFELPDVVLAAVVSADNADVAPAAAEARRPGRAQRVAKGEAAEQTEATLATGQVGRTGRMEPTLLPQVHLAVDLPRVGLTTMHLETSERITKGLEMPDPTITDLTATSEAPTDWATPVLTTKDPITAKLTARDQSATLAQSAEAAAAATPVSSPQRFTSTLEATPASRAAPATASIGETTVAARDATASTASTAPTASATKTQAAAAWPVPPVAPDRPRAAPELDRARATAFADTVDALYGVIADQRRAASDHSRRMKWMLSIVVGALLATVAIGVTQTLLLMRLTRETATQQQHIEQLMQTQQAAMVSLLDARLAAVNAVPEAQQPAPVAATEPAAATPPVKRPARAPHAHKLKPKAAATH